MRSRLCIPFTDSFVGLACSDGANESLHNRLKTVISHQMPYVKVIKKILRFIDNVNEQSKELNWETQKI